MAKSMFISDVRLSESNKLAQLLIIATLPIVLVGLFGSDFIESNRTNILNIAYMNLLFAGLLLVAYIYASSSKTIVELTIIGALFIGAFQVFALLPGASRSGTAITAALFIGLNLKDSSKFAFLLAIPTILGALVFLIADLALYQAKINASILVIGFVTSSIFALLLGIFILALV